MDDVFPLVFVVVVGVVWVLFGLLGHSILVRKQTSDGGTSRVPAIVSRPVAAVLGPIWFVVGFLAPPMQLCPYCKQSIRKDAFVCPRCTRDLATHGT